VAALVLVLSACAGLSPVTASRSSSVAEAPTDPATLQPPPYRRIADIHYATASPSEVLDLYLPRLPVPRLPLVMYVHGGAWTTGDKSAPEHAAYLPAILRRGYAFASINYRLTDEATFPAQIQDVKAAVRFMRANAGRYGLDPIRIAAWGDSSGGQLVSLLGTTAGVARFDDPKLGNPTTSSAVQAVVDWFGPVNFLTMDRQLARTPGLEPAERHDAATSGESRLVGAPIQSVPGRVRATNPITYLTPGRNVSPFLIAHGDLDPVVPVQQSVAFARALDRFNGVGTARLRIVAGLGSWKDFDAASEVPMALAFLDGIFRSPCHEL